MLKTVQVRRKRYAWTLLEKQRRTHKWHSFMDRFTWTCQWVSTCKNLYNFGIIFLIHQSFFVNYILSFGLVGPWTIRLSAGAGAHIEYSSRSCAEYMTITNVMMKTPGGNETGVWMTSCPEAMGWEFLVISEKDVSWDLTLGEASPAGGYGMHVCWDVSWEFDSGPGSPAGGWLWAM